MAHHQLTTQNGLLLSKLLEFYKKDGNMEKILPIINGESNISLRLIDWFATNYSKKYYTVYPLTQKSGEEKRFKVYNERGNFYHGNAEELSSFVPVETYDLIYSFGVIHHSPHPEKIISEIKKYMNKDSTLKIMLYATDSWKNYMIEAGHDQPEAQYGCPIANTYTNDEVRELLDGFDVTIEQYHIFPYQIEPYKRGEFVKQPWFEAMPDEIFEVLKKNLGWHLLITAKLL